MESLNNNSKETNVNNSNHALKEQCFSLYNNVSNNNSHQNIWISNIKSIKKNETGINLEKLVSL